MEKQNLTSAYLRLRSRLKAMAATILKNEDDADDALQEAFSRLWAYKEMSESHEIDGLAVVAVRRVCISYLRKRSVQLSLPIDDIPMAYDEPAEKVWDNEAVRDLTVKLMSKLSPLQKSVFDMVSQGMDYDVISLRLGMSEESVRQNLCRARKILRNEYKKIK